MNFSKASLWPSKVKIRHARPISEPFPLFHERVRQIAFLWGGELPGGAKTLPDFAGVAALTV